MKKQELDKLFKDAEIAILNLKALKARKEAQKARKQKKAKAMPKIDESKYIIMEA